MQVTDDILRRLERLERDNRRWKRGALALAAGLLGALVVGFAGPRDVEDVVEAKRFVLRGDDGKEYATLALDQQGNPNLLLRREKASAILTLSGPALHMRGDDGKSSAWIGFDPRGAARMELASEKLRDGIRAVVQPDGSSGVYAVDAEGRERATLEHLSTGTSQLTIRDAKGGIRAHVGLDGKDTSSALLLDSLGRRRIGMLVDPAGTPTLATEDGQGRLRTKLTMDSDGLPLFQLLRADGLPMFQEPK